MARWESHGLSQPVALAGGYLVGASLWIVCSDALVRWLQLEPDSNQLVHTLKGWIFVGLTGYLLFITLSRWQKQRLKAESALVESESRLRQIAENLQEVFWLTDPDKNQVLFVSSECERVWGYSSQIFYENPRIWLDSILEEDRSRVLSALPQQAQGTYDLTYRIRTPQGEERWIHDRAFPIADQHGSVYRVAGVARDITHERQADEALRESEDKYRCLFELSPEGVAIQMEGRIAFVNPAMSRLFGAHSKEQLEGLGMLDLVHPDHREEANLAMHQVMQGQAILTPRFRRLQRLDGSNFDGELLATPFARDGKKGALVLVRDITERNRIASVLEQQRSHLQAIIENSSDCIVALDQEGLVLWFNPQAEGCLGCTSQQASGQPWTQYFDAHVSEGLRADGQRFPAEFSESTVELANGPVKTIVFRDLSLRLRAEQKRKELEQQLRQAQKMEALGLLAGGVAHDFNNLLTVIQGAALLIRPGNDQDREYLEEIRHASQRAADLTRQLLTFSRKQVVQLQDLEVSQACVNVTKMLHRVLGEQIALTTELAAGLPNIHADAGMLEQVLLNLVVNARDALGPHGSVSIRTFEFVHDGTDDGFVLNALPGRYVCLEVEDNGSGIDPADLPHIFDPFYTTKDIGKGTGLGLATVYGIMEQHEGGLQVRTRLGHGTCVRAFFPALASAPSGRRRTPEIHLAQGKGKVLVAEDDVALQGLIRRILKRSGYEVLMAGNGVEAQSLWHENKEAIEYLITDLVMPGGVSGLDLGRRLLEEKPGLKVIYSSGYSTDLLDGGRGLTPGDCFLAKPYTPAQLAQALHDLQAEPSGGLK